MKKHLTYAISFFTLSVAFQTAVLAKETGIELIERGKAVSIAADCSACHTSPGGKAFSGGYKIASPMGNIISTNITPSDSYGIGQYTEQDFARAVRQGVLPDGTHLYPAMPYTSYKGMSDEDTRALYAYLKNSVEPVNDKPAEQTQLSFPFNIRAMMGGWNLLFSRGGWKPPAGLNSQQQRGAYLVDVLAHCGACHTPRGVMMNEDSSAYLTGGSVGGWNAPNITNDPQQGIGNWTNAQIVSYLHDGLAVGHGSAAGPMGEAVEHSFSNMPEADLNAIAVYLRTVPAPVTTLVKPVRAADEWQQSRPGNITQYEPGFPATYENLRDFKSITSGAQLYSGACASCHGEDGQGVKGAFPSLTSNATVGAIDSSNLIMVISDGISRHDGRGYTVMPAFKRDLNDGQIAALSNYVTGRFGNPSANTTAEKVRIIQSGGQAPWLVNNINLLMGSGVVFACLVIFVLSRLWRRKKSKHVENA